MIALEQLQQDEQRLLLPTYERNPVQFVRGQGCRLVDSTGAEWLDLLSGIGVNALGYGHPAVVRAITEQAQGLVHLSNLFFHDGQARLAEKLTALTGLHRAFFCNSGTEAWEAALKMARLYAQRRRERGERAGTKFLAVEHSFHGRTMGSVATTHKQKYREPFAPLMGDVEFVRANDVADLRARFSEDVCGICIEVIQGEGGIHEASADFLHAARELTQDAGSLLLFDEIQSGVGRTGKFCAYQHVGITPDIATLAKPLGGGVPIGVMLCTDTVAAAMQPGLHGTTFGGNVLATNVALAVLETLEADNLLAHVTRVGDYFKQQLHALAAKHDSVTDVRGRGLMLGMELATEGLAKAAAAEMFAQRILINRTSETVLRFLPPFILTEADVDVAAAALDSALTAAEAAQLATAGKDNADGH